jgi:hypothetical protein
MAHECLADNTITAAERESAECAAGRTGFCVSREVKARALILQFGYGF